MIRQGKDIYFIYIDKNNKEKRGCACIIDGIDNITIEGKIEQLKKKYGKLKDIKIYDSEFTWF